MTGRPPLLGVEVVREGVARACAALVPGLGGNAATRPSDVAAVLPVQGPLPQVPVAIHTASEHAVGAVLVPYDAAVMALAGHLDARLEARLTVVEKVIEAWEVGPARLGLKAVAAPTVVRAGSVPAGRLLAPTVLGAGPAA